MQGFKSFAKKTEIPFNSEINVILGPNGSGKSNISDALCFVFGRLSMKSIRANKSSNLIFLGTKSASPAKEAIVEVVFDNSTRIFTIDTNEISIKRIVRKKGQSIYKINNETKTRQEVLSLLAQAGIDPHGFNIILQGEIQNFVRMRTEERRKVIEEVSGISVYESRKEKSLKELKKTEEKLKEISAILRERTSYLANLEKERQQALRFKKLEKDVKICKASIINQILIGKKKGIEKIKKEISERDENIKKIRRIVDETEISTKNLESQVDSINSSIQKSTGLEQEKLNQEIANLRAELAGISVRAENHENKISSIIKQKKELKNIIREREISIKELKKETPLLLKKQKDLESKKHELEVLEEKRKKFYTLKSEIKSVRERINDKKNLLQNYFDESEFLINQIKSISKDLFDRKSDEQKVKELKTSLQGKKEFLEKLNKREAELGKKSYSHEQEIDKQRSLMENLPKMDICPLCKNKVTEEHIDSINAEAILRMNYLKKQIEDSDREISEISEKKDLLNQTMEQISSEISKHQSDLIKLSNINEKKEQIKKLNFQTENSKKEFNELEKKLKKLEVNFDEDSNIEEKYERIKIEVQEISLRNEENLNSEISFKQRDLEHSKISLKQFIRNEKELNEELMEIKTAIEKNRKILKEKNEQEEKLTKRFKKMISDREILQGKIRENQVQIYMKQNDIHSIEQEMNDFKIDKAKFDAEIENLEIEMLEFKGIETIKAKKEVLIARLTRIQEILSKIGSVNLRSLEVYDSVKKEYDLIKEKIEIIEKEKQEIFTMIHNIDVRKKKTFLKTLKDLNEIFSGNFSNLNTKGKVYLELENKKNPFEPGAGVRIIVKTGHGKYFDVTSLSGGEQVIIALSLIFAIQDLSPYHFYILDEIDAALDKRNSERLASLLQKYMRKGQYIVITHNDEIITNASNLYGVSMHDGVSKVISLKV